MRSFILLCLKTGRYQTIQSNNSPRRRWVVRSLVDDWLMSMRHIEYLSSLALLIVELRNSCLYKAIERKGMWGKEPRFNHVSFRAFCLGQGWLILVAVTVFFPFSSIVNVTFSFSLLNLDTFFQKTLSSWLVLYARI